ncbi:MAG: hypothetical protein J0M17_15150 [Planctomycetes bacterium]|nr:hypothetical protein [Planctomycetota bacterium]
MSFPIEVLDRIEHAVRRVQDCLDHGARLLHDYGIRYAVGGSNAASLWIATVDKSAVRQARDVELIVHAADTGRASDVVLAHGFTRMESAKAPSFGLIDSSSKRPILRLTTCEEFCEPSPKFNEIVRVQDYETLTLDALVRQMLVRHKLDDRVDLRDMMDVGLVDATWPSKFSPELAARLQHLLDTPDG